MLHSAARVVAFAADGEGGGGRHCRRDRHLVARQRARLVGTDDRDRAQRLDRRQAPDNGVPRRHAPHADGERDRDHRRQALGNGGHRNTDDDEEGVLCGVAAGEEGECEDRRREAEDDESEAPCEAVHLAQQRRSQRLDRTDQRADAPDLGVGTGGDDHAGAPAGGDERAREGDGAAVAERRFGPDRRR